jgi:Ser/Thr protein kinase RdoA (MazF antagonist)
MEKQIKTRFTDAILHTAIQCYDVTQVRLLDGFESFIYEFERADGKYILRIGHSLRRSIPMIQGEVDWINYLAAGGATVAPAIFSRYGRLVELVPDGQGGHFMATAFCKAPGQPPQEADWTPALLETYGQLLGRLHALTKDYHPADSAWRPHWNDAEMLNVEALLPPTDTQVRAQYHALMEHLLALPRDRDSYGLIHQDAHDGNMFIDGGRITLFDFDDCAYSWFMNDIAIVLFYAVNGAPAPAAFTHHFMMHFLRGYQRENNLAVAWLAEIPYFLKLREIDLYAVIHRSFDVTNLTNPWVARYMAGRQARIAEGVPYLDFDFTTLAADLA